MSEESKERSLTREVEAVQIPSGEPIELPALTKVRVTQQLGGSYTVMTPYGLARIDGSQADALGPDIAEEQAAQPERKGGEPLADGEEPDEEAIWQQLKNVYDPEIPVNIVDLGLVYSMAVEPTQENKNLYKVIVQMTLTAPGCGMGPAIAEDAKSKVMLVPGVDEAEVNLTWEPAWDQSMISEEGRMILGLV